MKILKIMKRRTKQSERSRWAERIGWIAVLLVFSAACREKGRPDPNIRMAMSHEPQQAAQPQGQDAAPASTGTGTETATPSVPTQLDVPPEVVKAYSGIKLRWKDATAGKEGTVDVPLEGTARIPDSDLEVRADVFLPAFSMSAQTITSTGIEPANPAARISVSEKGQQVFAGWIFTRFPDVHPFQHPRFSLRLEGGVPRKSS